MHIAFQRSDVPPADEGALRRFERRHEVALPDDYRRFLSVQNGGRPVEDLVLDTATSRSIGGVLPSDFLSIDAPGPDDLGWALEMRAYGIDWVASDLLPIASTPNGDFICLSLAADGGAVYYWNHELGPHGGTAAPGSLTRIADTFAAFTAGLRPADEVEWAN